jgi:hypothetical protein
MANDANSLREVLDAASDVIAAQDRLATLLLKRLASEGRLPAAGATPNPAPGKETAVCPDPSHPPESSDRPGSLAEDNIESSSVTAQVDEAFRRIEASKAKTLRKSSQEKRGAA